MNGMENINKYDYSRRFNGVILAGAISLNASREGKRVSQKREGDKEKDSKRSRVVM